VVSFAAIHMSTRAKQLAVAFEVAWALLLAYEQHRQSRFNAVPWRAEVVNYIQVWAAPAIAIVVVALLLDAFAGTLESKR
jgi:hypothetical protein